MLPTLPNSDKSVTAAVIGTGHFATAVVTQAAAIPQLHVPVVVDLNVAAAQRAYARAGIDPATVAVCESRVAALVALEQRQRVILTDATLLWELPIDVVLESTGVPEAGASHAVAAIDHGKHIVMVSKETDGIVGPILAERARRAGVVYTPVDGDQHGLLIALVEWARVLGLEVICGGKARDAEFVYDPAAGTVTCGQHTTTPTVDAWSYFNAIQPGHAAAVVAARREALAALPQVAGYDLVELAIAANTTGLLPDIPATHTPALHIAEMPEVFCSEAEGGILSQPGVIDCVTCLRQPHEAGLGGGVFIVVACTNDYSRHILHTKGLIPNSRGTAAVIYRPYHLCGVETPLSVLRAGLQGVGISQALPQPRVDVVAQTQRAMRSGETLGSDHSPDLLALMMPAQAVRPAHRLPLHMGNGNALQHDLQSHEMIGVADVVEPAHSTLWQLRREQDAHFGL
ncbi:MAG TPA: hypothetical protein P5121_16640 [Caldilineaceae bacterium]|nr:hypothetical protein [Caldilineaceae bacterium]